MKKNNPIRMCITCRKRESQKRLIRLQLIDEHIVAYRGFGRSMYLCPQCINDKKRMNGFIRRFRLDREKLFGTLKEFIKNG